MNKITKKEKMSIFDDLVRYYQFCKIDKRNHIFNAIAYEKKAESEQEKQEVKLAFEKAKNSYNYYCRMKIVALLLKWNYVDLVTHKERTLAINDAVFYYEWRIKTKKFYIHISEKKLKENESLSKEQVKETKTRLKKDKKEYDAYLKKLEVAKKLRDEINPTTWKKVEFIPSFSLI